MLWLYNPGTVLKREEEDMAEHFDVYADSLAIGAGPYGVSLNFSKSNPKPVAPGTIPMPEEIGTIRMSLEHFKLMAYIFKRHLDEIESQLGVQIQLPVQLLNQLKIAPEDWDKFWKK